MKLNQLGFTTIARSNTAPVQPGFQVGQVMAIDPTPGIFYDPSTTITLTVAVKPPCPTPTPSPPPRRRQRVRFGRPGRPVPSSSAPSGSPTPTANPSCTPG